MGAWQDEGLDIEVVGGREEYVHHALSRGYGGMPPQEFFNYGLLKRAIGCTLGVYLDLCVVTLCGSDLLYESHLL